MKLDFYDVHHASNYLTESIIRVAGHPVYVMEVGGRPYRLSYVPTDDMYNTRTSKTIMLDDEDVDLEPIPLGLCNYRSCSAYLTRIPRRAWKVGLTTRALHITWIRDNPGLGTDILWSENFVQMVKGRYPVLDTTKLLGSGQPSFAFDRHFTVVKERNAFKVYYKWRNDECIGEYSIDRRSIVLKEKFCYLRESLQERGLSCELLISTQT